jgi:hypothetical protein
MLNEEREKKKEESRKASMYAIFFSDEQKLGKGNGKVARD